MTDVVLMDKNERDKIMQDLDTNFLVEAGAGSGKTYSLVQRMANLVTTGTYEIREIVAITFTRKAADELKERFQTELEKRRKEITDSVIKDRIERALADFDQCYLGTVHSFCARLLRERPVEAGLDFDFKELDEREDKMIADEAWERYINDVRIKSPEKLNELAELGIDVASLRENLHELREYADVIWFYEETDRPTLDEVFSELKAFIEYVKTNLPDEEPDKGYDSLQKKIVRTIRELKYFDISKDKTKVSMLRPYQKKTTVTLNRWKDNDVAKEIRDERQIILSESVAPVLESWFEYCHSQLIPFLNPALVYYQDLKKKRSSLNFQDLLSESAKLLKENSEVRRYFQKKYRCLLVDEFQDTDPIQAELMMYLTGEEAEEKNWTKLTPRQGSLFVVGDPKQSIYRFRRADIDIYQRVKEMIASTGGEALNLTMNFRTTSLVTEPLNQVFIQHLPEQETSYQAAYRPLNSVKRNEPDEDQQMGIYKWTVPNARKTAEVIEADADGIARYIRSKLMNNEAQPRDFMVLTRYNGGIDDYAKKLEEYSIPVMTTGEVSLAEDEELRALLYVLKFLAEPTNSLYAAAVLRGPFFGVSDKLLYHFTTNGGRLSLFANIPESLETADREILTIAFDKLRQYFLWRRRDMPSTSIEKIMMDVGLLPLYMNLEKNKRDYTRVYQVLEKIRAYEAGGQSEFHSVVERLEQLIVDESMEEMTLPEEENAVRVMNVHKSKGLEAPIVFLAHPKKFVDQKGKIGRHIQREQEQSIGYFCFNNEKDELMAQPPNWRQLQAEEYEYLRAEEMRLVYVAATRAETTLVISNMDKGNEKNNPWHDLIVGIKLEDFQVPEDIVKPEVSNRKVIDLEEWKGIKEQVLHWADRLIQKTYEMERPTDRTEDDISLLGIARETGGGKDWGSVIHEAFEAVLQGKGDRNEVIEELLVKYEFPIERAKEVNDAIEAFLQSALWERCKQSDEWYAEIPFTVSIQEGHPLFREEKGETLLTGIIDLIFKENDQWIIVDYKTDRFTKKEDIEKLKMHYAKQINLYKQAWEEMTNEPVGEMNIYFVQTQNCVSINE
ncbi:UvrD-helicase domain-containing protein [Alkalihalobacterium alkalinitrilicum]|uniref:UvrD-helicase domain-containing protein n=1 Tax=Alkalihalobacterium alkalinitrilicum TaxID=427920 RepID=UPI0009951EE1|nr:UvrD-helicase domain-containing protein [Alkalihalobacterium alkalinitrilicum]